MKSGLHCKVLETLEETSVWLGNLTFSFKSCLIKCSAKFEWAVHAVRVVIVSDECDTILCRNGRESVQGFISGYNGMSHTIWLFICKWQLEFNRLKQAQTPSWDDKVNYFQISANNRQKRWFNEMNKSACAVSKPSGGEKDRTAAERCAHTRKILNCRQQMAVM